MCLQQPCEWMILLEKKIKRTQTLLGIPLLWGFHKEEKLGKKKRKESLNILDWALKVDIDRELFIFKKPD